MKIDNERKQKKIGRSIFPFLVLIILLSITFFASFSIYSIEQQNHEKRFDDRVSKVVTLIEKRFENYNQILSGGVGLFHASENVTRTEFGDYLEHQNIHDKYPGIQGVGYSIFIGDKDQLSDHIELIKEDYPEYTFKPVGDRDEYHSIIYLEPLDDRNKNAVGYDMYSQEIRREAMDKARMTGVSQLSGKVTLVQEIDEDVQAGFLLYTPNYEHFTGESSDQRVSDFSGFVYSPFRMNDFMNGLLIDSELDSVDFMIYDQKVSEMNEMYSHSEANHLSVENEKSQFEKTVEINIYGRKWVVVFNERTSFFANDLSSTWIVLGAGSVISFFMFFIILFYNNFMNKAADLNTVIDSVSRGKFDEKINEKLLKSNDELGTLARSFERIMVSLKLAMRETDPEVKKDIINKVAPAINDADSE